MADVELSKWDFYFYCHLLHKISVENSEFRNDIDNILCSVLNGRLLQPTTRKKLILEELPNSSETEDMRKIR